MLIGLTGLTGAGKSLAAGLLKSRGFYIIDGDKVGHRVTACPEILEKIRAVFGNGVINSDGSLNRRALGDIVFSDPEKLKALNAITHPAIKAEVLREAAKQGETPVVIDGAVIKECGLAECCAAVLRITAPEEVRRNRIMERDSLTEEQARRRIAAQTYHQDNWIDVDNSSTLEKLEQNLASALDEVIK